MKHTFSRLFVALITCFVCTQMVAENYLNPFAFRIDNIDPKNGAALNNDNYIIQYSLSGPATSVVIKLWPKTSTWTRDGGNTGSPIATIDITNEKDQAGKLCNTKGAHTYTVDFTHIIGQNTSTHAKDVRWTIDVMGGNQQAETTTRSVTYDNPTSLTTTAKKTENLKFINAVEVTEYKGFRTPGSVDICNDPYSLNFGVIFCTESRVITATNDDPSYVSYGSAPGVYVFGGDMERLYAHYGSNWKIACYGANFADAYHFVNGDNQYTARSPYRVRVSDDGRVFVSASEGRNNILKEITQPANADNNNYYEPNENGGKYTDIFSSGTWEEKNLRLKTSGGAFLAAPNSGLDTRSSGSTLQLLLLSANTIGTSNYIPNPTTGTLYPGLNPSEWNLCRYNLGDGKTWKAEPTEDILVTIKNSHGTTSTNQLINPNYGGKYTLVAFDNVSIDYDPHGGVWILQNRGNDAVAASMVHYNGVSKKVDLEEHVAKRSAGGIRHNHNNTKLVVAGGYLKDFYFKKGGVTYQTHSATANQLTVYNVSYKSDGSYTFTDKAYIDNANAGNSARDFAWDFADNLYIAASGTNRLMALALPHKGKVASTPARPIYNFNLSPVYSFNVTINPVAEAGATPYGTVIHERINRSPYPNYLHNALMNIRTDAIQGCKLYKYTGQSTGTQTDNRLRIESLQQSENITAHIGICVYEDAQHITINKDILFPAAFVQRELDNQSYSTICLPFHLKSLAGTAYEGATVLRFAGTSQSEVEGENKLFLNFEKVTFLGDDYMHAGVPYLIKAKNSIVGGLSGEKIFPDAQCPVIKEGNTYTHNAQSCTGNKHGGKSVTINGVTFHGFINPTTFQASETNFFVTADNRLTTLYDEAKVNGLRAYFSVSSPLLMSKIELNLPDKVATDIPSITTQQAPTKYLWNGKVYIQQNGVTYDLSGARVK